MAHPQPWGEFHSFCTLRKVEVDNAFWTYCDNFEYGKNPESRQVEIEPIGPITSSGLYEGYVRIPWLGDAAPMVIGDNNDDADLCCSLCGFQSKSGITLVVNGEDKSFCTNRHYLEWWNQQVEESERWSADYINNLETREQRYENDGSRKSTKYRLSVSEARLRNSASKPVGKPSNWGIFGLAAGIALMAILRFLF
jgi:hypothetical protein